MIVYREFSSLTEDLGFSGKTLYAVSNHLGKHYRTTKIPKRTGGYRLLCLPDELLKTIQRRINERLLCMEEISPYATAYRPGGSTRSNALPHVGQPVVLKLDIRDFFDRLYYPAVKEKAFPAERYSEQNRILLSLLCVYEDTLPQGAPTSPAISNIIMRDFDNMIGGWCAERGIAYTRYCDDMTFSGDFDPAPVIALVRSELRKMWMYLNERKTVVVRSGQRHSVTGIVVNEKLSIPADYKRSIRQQMYYCMKFGIISHLEACHSRETAEEFILRMLGRINYVLSVEPDNTAMLDYRSWLTVQRAVGDAPMH